MKGADDMRNVIKAAMVVAAALLLSSAGAEASTSTVLHAKVPFSFVVNGRTLPAGTYTIRRDDTNRSILLVTSDNKSRVAMFVSTIPDSGHDPAGSKPALYENQYRLASVWESNYEGWDLIGR
jgi:hypothetical protein